MKGLKFLVLIFPLIYFASCSTNQEVVFDDVVKIESGTWKRQDIKKFEVQIPDSSQEYNLYYSVRYGAKYPFYNLYLRMQITDSLQNEILVQDNELYLFHPSTGKPYDNSWMGLSSLGDLYDQQYPCVVRYTFPKAGKYTVAIKQFMRHEDYIPDLFSIGLRVKKSKQP